jgi:hypothetical protein
VTRAAPSPTIAAHSADDDAIEIEWRIAPAPILSFALDLAMSGSVIIPPPQVVSLATSVPQPRAHDPPDIAPKQPRSPPA